MKLLKLLLLCFLFFGLGNFKAQKIEKISNEEQSRFVFVENFQNLLMKNYSGKRNQINFKNAKLSDLKIQYLKNSTLLAPEDNINLKLLADYTFFSLCRTSVGETFLVYITLRTFLNIVITNSFCRRNCRFDVSWF